MKRKLKIVSTGKYLPKKTVTGEQVDQVLGLTPGASAQMSGVKERRYADETETCSMMGAFALMDAFEKSPYKFEDIDALICTSGTMEQEIPCNGALIQKALGKSQTGIPCFDINSTCLSFVTGLDLASSLITTGRYKRIALVSSEVASVGLNPEQHEAYALFGDGAAAVIIEAPEDNETAGVISASMKTFSEGADYCKIEGGGSKFHPRKYWTPEHESKFMFRMDGRKVFKLVLETIKDFYDESLKTAGLKTQDLELIIPHQASGSGMELVRRKLEIPTEKYMDILSNHGNMIAASIPLALHYAIEQGRIQRGNKVMLLGTSAGVSFGSVIFEY